MGSRVTCCCTARRISVIDFCAAMPSTCDRAKPVAACTRVAAPAASASGHSRSPRDLPTTSSISTLEVAGRTSPARRLTAIKAMPTPRRARRAQMRSRASRQTTLKVGFFLCGCVWHVVSCRAGALRLLHSHANQFDALDRLLAVHALGFNRLDNPHPADDPAENRVGVVERGRRRRADEKRGRRARRIGRARHGDDACHVQGVVELGLQRGHVAELLLRQRLLARGHHARLDDEAFDDPVDAGAVVDPRRGQPQEVAHVLRGLHGVKRDRDGPFRRLDHRAVLGQLLHGLRRKRHGFRWRRVADGDREHLDPIGHPPLLVHRRFGDRLHHFEALDDTPKHRDGPVEGDLVGDGDEELAAGAIGLARLQHGRDRATRHRLAVELLRQHTEAAGAIHRPFGRVLGQRVAALDEPHPQGAVKRRLVERALASLCDEVADVIGRDLGQQLDDERAARGLDDGLLALHVGRRQGRGEQGCRLCGSRGTARTGLRVCKGRGQTRHEEERNRSHRSMVTRLRPAGFGAAGPSALRASARQAQPASLTGYGCRDRRPVGARRLRGAVSSRRAAT